MRKKYKDYLLIFIVLIAVCILQTIIFCQMYSKHVNVTKPFCEETCANPKNMPAECGTLIRLPNCNDEDAPDTVIFGIKNKNKLFWCYDFYGGECGNLHQRFYFVLLLTPIFAGLASLGIMIAMIVSLRIENNKNRGDEEE